MHIHRALFLLGACGLALCLTASAQSRKAGLWEVTSTMKWQQSPFPAGTGHMGGGPRTMQVCVTQAEIDKYGSVPPQAQKNCQIENVVKKSNGMTAEMVCTGLMAGKGQIESSWTDAAHTSTKMHYLGAMQMGEESKPIEWTIESTSVYKGPDCGSVKPIQAK